MQKNFLQIIFTIIFINVFMISRVYPSTSASEKKLNHLAIIADGNRRWAKANNLSIAEGHHTGFAVVAPRLLEESFKLNIHTITIWCSSPENWKRKPSEVANFMQSFNALAEQALVIAKKNRVKIVHLGRKDRIPTYLKKTLEFAEEETKNFDSGVINLGIDYGSRDEIRRAFQKILDQQKEHPIIVTEDMISDALDTAGQPFPNPDLIIRTSGEQRTSGLMAWQSTYSELYFANEYFPDFNKDSLRKAILEFSNRQRRFGK